MSARKARREAKKREHRERRKGKGKLPPWAEREWLAAGVQLAGLVESESDAESVEAREAAQTLAKLIKLDPALYYAMMVAAAAQAGRYARLPELKAIVIGGRCLGEGVSDAECIFAALVVDAASRRGIKVKRHFCACARRFYGGLRQRAQAAGLPLPARFTPLAEP